MLTFWGARHEYDSQSVCRRTTKLVTAEAADHLNWGYSASSVTAKQNKLAKQKKIQRTLFCTAASQAYTRKQFSRLPFIRELWNKPAETPGSDSAGSL